MDKIVWSVIVVWLIIYIVPFAIYSGFSMLTGLAPPSGVSPLRFLLGVAISKLGTALVFVMIFFLAGDAFAELWWAYALLWWLMFVIEELGKAIGPDYGWQEAVAGIVSETVYFPLSAFVTRLLLFG
jgi:hypothetical protein